MFYLFILGYKSLYACWYIVILFLWKMFKVHPIRVCTSWNKEEKKSDMINIICWWSDKKNDIKIK